MTYQQDKFKLNTSKHGLGIKMDDKYAGHGGTFVLDPDTGLRKLVEQTKPANNPAPDSAPEDLNDATISKKDNASSKS